MITTVWIVETPLSHVSQAPLLTVNINFSVSSCLLIKCPAVRFAINRTVRVIGRINILINSILTKNGAITPLSFWNRWDIEFSIFIILSENLSITMVVDMEKMASGDERILLRYGNSTKTLKISAPINTSIILLSSLILPPILLELRERIVSALIKEKNRSLILKEGGLIKINVLFL